MTDMDISANIVRELTGFVELNACSLSSSGLYEGKAGQALCLFEMARYFEEEAWENEAFELLQEALVSKTGRIDFGFGWSGIGYALLYLIGYQFIKADFDSVFGRNTEKIRTTIQNTQTPYLFFDTIPFLASLNRHAAQTTDSRLIERILDSALDTIIHGWESARWKTERRKDIQINRFQELLRMLYLLESEQMSHLYDPEKLRLLCRLYSGLYHRQLIANRHDIGFFMGRLSTIPEMQPVAEKQCRQALAGIVPDTTDLKTRIQLSVAGSLMEKQNDTAGSLNSLLPFSSEEAFDQTLGSLIARHQKRGSLSHGIPCLLLYYLFTQYGPASTDSRRLLPFLL